MELLDAPCPISKLALYVVILLVWQILDHYFGNVCELDLVFGFHKVYCILDEFIIGGEIQETSKKVGSALGAC
jgi:AP-2 complex subunit sigma-1